MVTDREIVQVYNINYNKGDRDGDYNTGYKNNRKKM